MSVPQQLPFNGWRVEDIRGLIPETIYEYVRQRYQRYAGMARVLHEDAISFGQPLTADGTKLLTRYMELHSFPAEYLQRFFVRLGNLLPSRVYDEPVRETYPNDSDRCLTFELLADAIVDVADQAIVESQKYESPPRDHPAYVPQIPGGLGILDISRLDEERYSAFKESVSEGRVALVFQEILHPSKATLPGNLYFPGRYAFNGGLSPQDVRTIEEARREPPRQQAQPLPRRRW